MIGDHIRDIRKSRGMTLKDLAEAVGVTPSYISQLERNLADPSLSTLRRISRALDISMSSFLDEDADDSVVVIRSGFGRKLAPTRSVNYEYFTPIAADVGSLKMEVLRAEIAPGASDSEEFIVHDAEECTHVVSGALRVFSDGNTYELHTGDSIYIRSNVPHRFFNPGTEPVVTFSCVTPAL